MMDPNRDNPFIRFSAFWLGLGTVLIFAVLLMVFALISREKPDDLEELAAQKRYETKATVEAAQAEELSVAAIHAAIPEVAKTLAANKPVAFAPKVEGTSDVDPAIMELGAQSYLTCTGCHGQKGEGVPSLGPPLAGSEWVTGPVENLIRIQLRGLTGPITVKGVEYNPATPMIPLASQTDEQIAAVLTFVRNSFGNKASIVTPDQVQALRSEVGKPMLTVEDLIQP